MTQMLNTAMLILPRSAMLIKALLISKKLCYAQNSSALLNTALLILKQLCFALHSFALLYTALLCST